MEMEILGAIKIKDGLFVGDEFAAQDLEFVVANKVTHIVNCAGRQVPNHWEPIGVQYLSFYWLDHDSQNILDPRDEIINEVTHFIETTIALGESVLIHSVRGQSRSCILIAAYLMKKFRWNLIKTLEYLSSRRPDLQIRPTFVQQLANFELKINKQQGPRTTKWTELSEDPSNLESEELLLSNTFLNSKIGQMQFSQVEKEGNQKGKLQWIDNSEDNQNLLINYNHERSFNPIENGLATIKPMIKGAAKNEQKVPVKYQRIKVYPQNETKTQSKTQQVKGQKAEVMNNNPQYQPAQPQVQSNLQTGLVSKATTDDIQKLADALHNNIRGKKGLVQKREISPAIKKPTDQASLRFKVQQRNEQNTQQTVQQQMSKSLKTEQQKQLIQITRPTVIKQQSATMKVRNPYIKPPEQQRNAKIISRQFSNFSGGFKQENRQNRPNTAPSNHRNQSPGKSGTIGPNAIYGISYGSSKKGKWKS